MADLSTRSRGRVRPRLNVEKALARIKRDKKAASSIRKSAQKRTVYLTATDASVFLRLSPVTLSKWRVEGKGPPYRKFGRRVVYARRELLRWAKQQARNSTSDLGR